MLGIRRFITPRNEQRQPILNSISALGARFIKYRYALSSTGHLRDTALKPLERKHEGEKRELVQSTAGRNVRKGMRNGKSVPSLEEEIRLLETNFVSLLPTAC